MQSLALTSPLGAAILLAPALVFAGLGLMRDAPGEWGQGALIAWTALAVALLAGAGPAAAGGLLPWLALALGFAAVMIGGPPGLAIAALAAALLLVLGPGAPVPRWPLFGLAAAPALVALRQTVAG